MRWEPLLIILGLATLGGLLIIAVSRQRRWAKLLSLVYVTGLAIILFTPISVSGTELYLMPLGVGRVNLTNFNFNNLGFLENILLTIPLGALLKRWWPHLSFFGMSCMGLLVGGSFETVQYVLSHHWLINRSSDINDVLANAIGMLIGGLVAGSYLWLTNSRRKKRLSRQTA